MTAEEQEEIEQIKKVVESKKENLWRFKLALIHRVNQKEILHNQLKFVKILLAIMIKVKKIIEVASLQEQDAGADDEF